MSKINRKFNLTGGFAVITILAFFFSVCFYIIHCPADTRTKDDITVYSEGIPDTWQYDKLMNKMQPQLLEEKRLEVMGNKQYEKNEQGQPLIPGDVTFQAREKFLRILSLYVGIIIFIIAAIPTYIYAVIERKKNKDNKNE